MKKSKIITLMLPLVTILLGGCGQDITKASKNMPLDTVIEFSVSSFFLNAGKKLQERYTVYYGQDTHGNIRSTFTGEVYLYGDSYENNTNKIYIKNGSTYELYDYSKEDFKYHSKGNVTITSTHDTISHYALTANTYPNFTDGRTLAKGDWKSEKIDAISYEAEGLQDLLDNANCSYYKLTKKDSNEYYEIAVQKDYKWSIFQGHYNSEGDYVPELIPTLWNTNNTNNYASLI